MPLTHAPLSRDDMTNALTGRINNGSAMPSGRLQIASDSGFSDIIVALSLQLPAFAAATGGSASLVIPGGGLQAVYAGGPTKIANYFRFVDRNGGEVFRGTVSAPTGSGDIKLADNVIPNDTTVVVTTFVYTHIP